MTRKVRSGNGVALSSGQAGKKPAKAAKASAETKAAAKQALEEAKKPLSQKMREAIERHRRMKAKLNPLLLKTGKRRGRKPKNIDYAPDQQEEDPLHAEPELERLEYDTGIQIKVTQEDPGFAFEKGGVDDELNFDWS